jgi:hypothetical protein
MSARRRTLQPSATEELHRLQVARAALARALEVTTRKSRELTEGLALDSGPYSDPSTVEFVALLWSNFAKRTLREVKL